jgi:hypothetical protein
MSISPLFRKRPGEFYIGCPSGKAEAVDESAGGFLGSGPYLLDGADRPKKIIGQEDKDGLIGDRREGPESKMGQVGKTLGLTIPPLGSGT